MFRNLILALTSLALGVALSACQSDPGASSGALRPVDPRIETCSAGSSVALSTEAKLDLSDLLTRQNGMVNATVQRKLSTMISDAAGDSLTGADLVKAQENYLACLRDEADRSARASAPWKHLSDAECRAAYACEDQNIAQFRTCQDVAFEMYQEGAIDKPRARAAISDCRGVIADNPGCYQAGAGAQLKTARALCAQKIGSISEYGTSGGEDYRHLVEQMKANGLI